MGGGGRRDLVHNFFQPPLATELGIGGVPSNRFLYSWQFGNLNFNATFDLIETLVTADWPILVVCNHELVMDKSPPAWVSGVLTISTDSVEGVISSFDTFTSKIQQLARAVDGAAINFGNPGLVYQYDENGVLKSMEVHAWMDGLVAGFDYQVLVQEAGGMWSEGWSQNFALKEALGSKRWAK